MPKIRHYINSYSPYAALATFVSALLIIITTDENVLIALNIIAVLGLVATTVGLLNFTVLHKLSHAHRLLLTLAGVFLTIALVTNAMQGDISELTITMIFWPALLSVISLIPMHIHSLKHIKGSSRAGTALAIIAIVYILLKTVPVLTPYEKLLHEISFLAALFYFWQIFQILKSAIPTKIKRSK